MLIKFGAKKRKTKPVLPNTTRLDILRKRATRLRSREARHNLKRRDITAALQSVFDNLPSPPPQMAMLKQTPALIPPSLDKIAQSPVTPAPTKRRREGTPLGKSVSPVKPVSTRKILSPKKNIVIRPSPVKETPKVEFGFVFGEKKNDKILEDLSKPTPRYEVYSKIFGPPPQLSKTLVDKDTTQPLPPPPEVKSPTRKRRILETIPQQSTSRKDDTIQNRSVRNELFAVPIVPAPPGPPQLPPSIQRNNPKRFPLNGSILPSPAQPPPSVVRSALPRPAARLTGNTTLPVPTRRSARSAAPVNPPVSKSNVINTVSSVVSKDVGPVPEKKVPEREERESVNPPNVTVDRPKGKLGGAQRVTRNGETTNGETKKVLCRVSLM
jgi:hypothetical protein